MNLSLGLSERIKTWVNWFSDTHYNEIQCAGAFYLLDYIYIVLYTPTAVVTPTSTLAIPYPSEEKHGFLFTLQHVSLYI